MHGSQQAATMHAVCMQGLQSESKDSAEPQLAAASKQTKKRELR